jgi:Ca-activated chloride channel family protein
LKLRFFGLILLLGGWLVAGLQPSLNAQAQSKRTRRVALTKRTPTPTPKPTLAPKAVADQYKLNIPVITPPLQTSSSINSAQPPAAKAPGETESNPQTKPQTKPPDKPKKEEEPAESIRINSNLVAVPVSVTDANGEPVRTLRAEDFRLEEEGQKQEVQRLGEPGKTPIELALLFDVSGSVRERFEFEKLAASRFLKEVLKPSDTVAVFSIGFDAKLVTERSSNVDNVINGLRGLEPTKEGTAFFDTVVKAAQYLNIYATPGSRRVVIAISDGEDNHSDRYRLFDAQRELQRTDSLFYSINPSGPSIRLNKISLRGQESMTTLATDTGGVAFLPDKDEDLEKVFKQITAELQAQYLLGYYSTNEATDGKFRRIKIQLPKYPNLRIRARQGYYAPKD